MQLTPREDVNRRMLRARDEMDRHYAEPLDVPTLAGIAHLSASQFGRVFKEVYGETPHRYLQRRRVERAMTLLRQSDRAVTDIAWDVGSCRRASWRPGRDRARALGPRLDRQRFRRSTSTLTLASVLVMTTNHITSVRIKSVPVLDQDEALAFYSTHLGFEVHDDINLGFMRWLTVALPGGGVQLLLELVGSPQHDETTAAQVRELVTKGARGGLFLASSDIHATYAALRDAFGNHVRISQPAD